MKELSEEWIYHCAYHLTTSIVSGDSESSLCPVLAGLGGWSFLPHHDSSYDLLSLVLDHHAQRGNHQLRFQDMATDILVYLLAVKTKWEHAALRICDYFRVQIPSFHSLRHMNLVSQILCLSYTASHCWFHIHRLKSCEPEFLVATPERLLELISLKAIDISGVSLLVVDGLDTLCKGGYLDMIKSIRQSISGNPHAVVFSERSSCTSVPGVEDLLRGSYCRLPLKGSINNQSACIAQSIHA
ncbi:uncharacterized protein LOC117928080 [Vitis riparia]|uniref:uncharacterized protein LOC117928080 n=1 Tax=Vitis riparia TaxID=96939 RepID=UPI00155A9318|nr:uncharacterized protein LOC117928080 [Vitis riparia]